MKTLLVLALLGAAHTVVPVKLAPKPAPACIVQTPRGPKACAPEPPTPPSCTVKVLKSDGSSKSIPCR